MEELQRESAFYKAHRDEYRKKYYNQYLLIADGKLHGVYDKFAQAAKTALENYEPGKFMIHKPADEDRVIDFISFSDSNSDNTFSGKTTYTKGEPIAFSYAH